MYATSAGNAYFTELLVTDLDPRLSRLPPGVPTALREALLAAWHRLDPEAREVVQLLAVGGRPLGFDDLVAVARTAGISDPALSAALSDAIEAGLVVTRTTGEIWFRHPLLADVLDSTLHPGQAGRIHAAFVTYLEGRDSSGDAIQTGHFADLALHYELAGRPADAFRCAIRAADTAAQLQGYAEQSRQLGRAIDLWPCVPAAAQDGAGGLVSLLMVASGAANRSGDDESAFAHVEHALGIVDHATSPLLTARLLCEWCGLVFRTGRSAQFPLAEAKQALALTLHAPDSAEHALGLAITAEAENWYGYHESARAHSDLAIEAAARSGTAEAMSWALAAKAFVRGDEPAGLLAAEDACRIAALSGEHQIAGRAASWWTFALYNRGRLQEAADVAVRAFDQATVSRPAAATTVLLAGQAARILLELGDLSSAPGLVREGLARRSGGIGGARVRVSAARLAVMSGRVDEAGQHLRRAEELVPSIAEYVGMAALPTYASHLIACGRPDRALDVLHRSMPSQALNLRLCDELVMWGARAAAELGVAARGRQDETGVRRPAPGWPIWSSCVRVSATHRTTGLVRTTRCRRPWWRSLPPSRRGAMGAPRWLICGSTRARRATGPACVGRRLRPAGGGQKYWSHRAARAPRSHPCFAQRTGSPCRSAPSRCAATSRRWPG